MTQRFSRRLDIQPVPQPIQVVDSVPDSIRYTLFTMIQELRLNFKEARRLVCGTLRVAPDENNWSETNVTREVQLLLMGCEWYEFYDVCEALYAFVQPRDRTTPLGDPVHTPISQQLEEELNRVFVRDGVGWYMRNGLIERRGSEDLEALESQVTERVEVLRLTEPVQRLRDARRDLSRRPEPDLKGAVIHATGAIEALVRSITGDNRTLGA